MKLQYRTRENSAPHGKPSVYLALHPADKELYLEATLRELLYFEDCVVWFDDYDELSADFADELSLMNMQLLVIPVTHRLLSEPNRVTESELHFANDNGIPIMPIMMESGLEAPYAKVFGDLQFLDKSSPDPTAIPYAEKIERHLTSVLVSADTTADVRAAFDARLFLSYRKKDREKAQTLMRLIHAEPEFQGIGIWYDEFLVPGEDFNDSIREAIKSSDMFVMNVTPNLVNEDNFIRDPEYLWAKAKFGREHNRFIIPAQTEYTDQKEMRACFSDIRDNIDAYCRDELRAAILAPIAEKLIHTERTPHQNYLLGLAYLHGIDMEKNGKRGVEFITSAAENGDLDAKKKLVYVYSRGQGTERDYDKQIYWQNEVIKHYRALCEGDADIDTRLSLANEQVYLGDDLLSLRRFSEAARAYENALLDFNALLTDDGADTTYCRERILHIGNELGFVYGTDKKPNEAINAYNAAKNVAEAMSENEKTLLIRQRYAQILSNLGCQYLDIGNTTLAYDNCFRAFEVGAELLETEKDDQTTYAICMAAYHLGCVFMAQRDPKKAEQYFGLSLLHAKEHLERLPNVQFVLLAAECFRKSSECLKKQGDFKTASAACETGLQLLSSVSAQFPSPQVKNAEYNLIKEKELTLIFSDGSLGDIRPRFVKIADDCVAESPTTDALRTRAKAYTDWARACSLGGNSEKAEKCYRRAIKYFAEIVADKSIPEDLLSLNSARISLADLLCKLRQRDNAFELLDTALTELSDAVKASDLPEFSREKARCHFIFGIFYRQQLSGSEKAAESFTAAKDIYDSLFAATGDNAYLLHAIECLTLIADCYIVSGKDTEKTALACELSKKAIENLEEIYTDAAETIKLMEKCLRIHSKALEISGDKAGSAKYLKKANELGAKLNIKKQ